MPRSHEDRPEFFPLDQTDIYSLITCRLFSIILELFRGGGFEFRHRGALLS